MDKLPLRLCIYSALFVLVAATPALAKKPKEPERHATVISSVSPTSITIAEDKVMKTFTITQFTEITVKGQRAKLTDLQPGMSVSVTLSDPTKLSRINAGDPPPVLAAPKK